MIKKILVALIALAVMLCAFSCAKKPTENKDNGNNTEQVGSGEDVNKDIYEDDEENEEIDYESSLSNKKFDGYEFRVLTRKGSLERQVPEADSEDLVVSATFKRNKLVEDRFGIKIVGTETSSSDFETEALNSILAGDDAYDIVFTHSRAALIYAIQGAAYNINDVESIHLEKPWWNSDLADTFNINGNMYILDGDISISSLGFTNCMFFNKNIFDELGYEYPYEMVKDGDWTFDEFSYLARKGGADLNGDGVMKPEDDRFGFYDSEWNGPIQILYTGGQKIYDKNDAGELDLTIYSNKTVEIFDSYFDLMENRNCFLNVVSSANAFTGDLFGEGRAMMMTGGIGSAASLRKMDDEFGIIPYPKFTEDDEYAAITNGFADLAIIPITVPDIERTGAIVEALCAYGSREVIPAYYEVALKTKAARDDESKEMLDIIKDSIVYDIGYLSSGPFSSTGVSLALTSNHDFASFYASHKSEGEAAVREFYEDYGKTN